MIDLDNMEIRDLQKQCARALATMQATNNNISRFNKEAHHDSQNWYKAVIKWYIDQYGDLPSQTGPGKDVKLIIE
jgi:hypothetical protein